MSLSSFPVDISDPDGRSIKLTHERWSHVVDYHGELTGFRKEVLETVKNPEDRLQEEGRSDTVHYFRELEVLPHDYMCVVVNIEKEFIVTAYPTNRKRA